MADQATFDFPTFKVHVRFVGQENEEPTYETAIEAPGHEPMQGGTILNGPPLLTSAAGAAVSEMRRLLREGVKTFFEEYKASRRGISFKELQDVRLMFLSWYDLAAGIGDAALQAAQDELKARRPAEYRETYGREMEEEPEDELPPADAQYDLGNLMLDVRVMGLVEGLPLWGVTATVPGTDLNANSIIGVDSPLAIHAAQGMLENLKNVLRLGVDRYFAEEPRARRRPVTPEKRAATEMLYVVANTVGADGLVAAEARLEDMLQNYIDSLEGQAISDMEQRIAEYRKRKPKS